MGCGGSKLEKEKTEFFAMLKRSPDLKNYAADKTRQLNFGKAWTSSVFGGSVLSPIGVYKGKRTRYNVLD